MSMFISSLMFIALFAVALAHLLWSFGKTWPIRDEKLLAQTVVGTSGIDHMPPRYASFGVAILALAAGVLALSLADHDSGGAGLSALGIVAGLIFVVRGSIGYSGWWKQRTPEPNFRFNDTRVYSPLCLLLGLGFFVLSLLRLS